MVIPNKASPPAEIVHFAPERAFHLLALAIMVLAIGAGLARYFGWPAGLIMGLALSHVFSALAKTLLAPAGTVARSERVLAGVFALALFGVTMGLSYGTLYGSLFAQSSALGEFSRVRGPVERQLESVVLANGEAAVHAFGAWQAYSSQKAAQEGQGGGSCPGRAQSQGARGPIAMWRENEAGIATNLHDELKRTVHQLRGKFELVKQRKAGNFAETSAISASLNQLIETAEGLARGSYIAATQATLSRQLASRISGPDGRAVDCGDRARDELILRAQAALNALADTRKNPPIAPLAPAIDLANQQELTIRGLLRAFNGLGMLASFGWVGNFADDPLMEMALKNKGLINRETLGFLIAGLIELCVLFTAFLAARSGAPAFPYRPGEMLRRWETRLAGQRPGLGSWLSLFWLGLCKTLLNLLFTRPQAIAAPAALPAVAPDPRYGRRELEWSRLLAHHLFANDAGEYLVIPNAGAYSASLLAAQALEYQGHAARLNLDVSWETVSSYWPVASRFGQRLPDVIEMRYAVYKLKPDFAQALRLKLLESVPAVAAR